jgi:hypothetical protein
MFMLDTTLGTRFADHATAACTSTYVGCWEQSRTTGLPTVHSAVVPVPVTVVLKRPPAITPAPLTRLMSQVSAASKASRLRPLTLIPSPSSSTR